MKILPVVILLAGACLSLTAPAWGASSLFDPTSVMVENARMSDAEEMLQQWLGEHAEDQEARFLLARILAWQDKRVEALAEYDRLLAEKPNNSDYLLGKSLVLVRGGQAQAALPLLRKARRLSPDYEDVWRLQVQALRAVGGESGKRQARIVESGAGRRFPHSKQE